MLSSLRRVAGPARERHGGEAAAAGARALRGAWLSDPLGDVLLLGASGPALSCAIPPAGCMRIDAVLGTEMNPLMSGIAKFNAQLARRLGVPVARAVDDDVVALVSLRSCDDCLITPFPLDDVLRPPIVYDLFLHGQVGQDRAGLLPRARRVFSANAALAGQIRPIRPDVISAWCPSLLEHVGAFPSADLTLFSFGMGHKLSQLPRYTRLEALLEATGLTYSLYLSSGLHSGASVQDAAYVDLERLFGHHVIFLGILSDRAVAHYLATSTYVVAFFDRGLRENNTTVLSALAAGATVITNCDAQTPDALRTAVLDIDTRPAMFRYASGPYIGTTPFTTAYTWGALTALVQQDAP